jgi:hypothetical protein
MMNATDLQVEILKALLRVEKKQDEILKYAVSKGHQTTPMSYMGEPCPLCQRKVENVPHQLSEGHFVVVRSCGCEPVNTQMPQPPVIG